MAAMLLGAVVTTQIEHPRSPPRPESRGARARAGGLHGAPGRAITLDTFREIARRQTLGVVNVNTSKVVNRQNLRDPFGNSSVEDQSDQPRPGPRGAPGRERPRPSEASAPGS